MEEHRGEETKSTADGAMSEVVAEVFAGSAPGGGLSRGALIFRGILFIIAGLLMAVSPYESLRIIAVIVGAFMAVEAVFLLIGAAKGRTGKRGLTILYAVLVLILGVMTMARPLLVGFFWIIMIGVWQIFSGINTLTADYNVERTGWLRFSGVLSILVGLLFIIWPLAGLGALMLVTGFTLLFTGVITLAAGIAMRRRPKG